MVSRTVAALTPDDEQAQDGQRQKVMDGETPDPAAPSNAEVPHTANAGNEKKAQYSTSAKDRKKLSVEECLYLATRGGASCLGLSQKIGAFEVGMEWDAQLIKLATIPSHPAPPPSTQSEDVVVDGGGGGGEGIEDEMGVGGDDGLVELWGGETWSEKVAKWLFCGDDRNTRKVFVRGRLVHERL